MKTALANTNALIGVIGVLFLAKSLLIECDERRNRHLIGRDVLENRLRRELKDGVLENLMDHQNTSNHKDQSLDSNSSNENLLFEWREHAPSKRSATTGLDRGSKTRKFRKIKFKKAKYLEKNVEFNNNMRTKLSDSELLAKVREKLQTHAKENNIGNYTS